jgi:hypothetical protein
MGQTEDQYREKQRIKHNNSAGIELRAEIATSDLNGEITSAQWKWAAKNNATQVFQLKSNQGLH